MNEYNERFNKLKEITNNEEYLNKLISTIKEILYERTSFVKNSDNDSLRNEYFNTILKDTISNTYNNLDNKTNMNTDIEYIGSGHSSLVFRIGDLVFKIEKSSTKTKLDEYDDFTCTIPVLSSDCFKVDEKEFYTTQVTPLVDTNEIEEEEVYEAYKNLRDLGYIWNDPKAENIGRIMHDITINGHEYKKGDIVIIDLEDFAYVGEITPDEVLDEISWSSYNSKTYTYETRHMREKGQVK